MLIRSILYSSYQQSIKENKLLYTNELYIKYIVYLIIVILYLQNFLIIN